MDTRTFQTDQKSCRQNGILGSKFLMNVQCSHRAEMQHVNCCKLGTILDSVTCFSVWDFETCLQRHLRAYNSRVVPHRKMKTSVPVQLELLPLVQSFSVHKLRPRVFQHWLSYFLFLSLCFVIMSLFCFRTLLHS